MFIDFVPLMLVNMAAGLVLLASWVLKAMSGGEAREWCPAFLVVGLVGMSCGLRMTFAWPLPGSYNVAFGQLSVLLGALFLGASLSLGKGWNLLPLGIYAVFAGLTAVLVGIRVISLGLTKEPLMSGIGFMATGLCGVLTPCVLRFRRSTGLKILVVLLLVVAAVIWLMTAYMAYWGHLKSFSGWLPATMQKPPSP